MSGYEYRRVEMGWGDLLELPDGGHYRLFDSALGELSTIQRVVGEAEAAFAQRKRDLATEYLNPLGRDGWRILYFTPSVIRAAATGVTLIADWPGGTHVLAREVSGELVSTAEARERPERLQHLRERLRMLAVELSRRPVSGDA